MTIEYPYEGVITADQLKSAFWAAASPFKDDIIYSVDQHRFWEHMARALMDDDL